MQNSAKKLSGVTFAMAVLCFFLPFVTFSCQGEKVASFTGIQLMTGASIQQPQMFGASQERKSGGEPLAVVAFLCVAAGLAVSFVKGRKGAVLPALAGGLGLIVLLLLKSKLDNDVLTQSEGMVQMQYEAGFYLTLLLSLAAAGVNGYAWARARGARLGGMGVTTAGGFCTQCSSKNPAGDAFCKECGAKFEARGSIL
ncbi:MAG TPA: zinc ribbon domain-containing protein [Terriglobia bacterium]|nr:zinc ribbon domain-containing protein [Terriglobia bacterium]